MLERLVGWFRLLWDAGKLLQEHTESIESSKENEQKMLAMMQALLSQNQELKRELQHEKELRAKDLENLELRLRLQISEQLRQLPPKD